MMMRGESPMQALKTAGGSQGRQRAAPRYADAPTEVEVIAAGVGRRGELAPVCSSGAPALARCRARGS